ncbi:hypothetical protein D3C87_1463130 [compost metagenome]
MSLPHDKPVARPERDSLLPDIDAHDAFRHGDAKAVLQPGDVKRRPEVRQHRVADDHREGMAVVVGDLDQKPPLVQSRISGSGMIKRDLGGAVQMKARSVGQRQGALLSRRGLDLPGSGTLLPDPDPRDRSRRNRRCDPETPGRSRPSPLGCTGGQALRRGSQRLRDIRLLGRQSPVGVSMARISDQPGLPFVPGGEPWIVDENQPAQGLPL